MKQRLIDANELHPTYHQGFYVAGVMVGGSYTIDYEEIEDAPTVDAIPVEWIERYMESVGRIGYVEVMLDDWKAEQWKKENER